MNYIYALRLKRLVSDLRVSRLAAIRAGMDEHFLGEIDHLIATANANLEEHE